MCAARVSPSNEVSPRAEEKSREVSPRAKEKSREVSPRAKGKSREVSPRAKEKSREVSPRAKENSRDVSREVSPRAKDKSNEVSPRAKENSREVSPRAKDKSNEVTPRDKEKSNEVSQRSAEKSREVSPRVAEKSPEFVPGSGISEEGGSRASDSGFDQSNDDDDDFEAPVSHASDAPDPNYEYELVRHGAGFIYEPIDKTVDYRMTIMKNAINPPKPKVDPNTTDPVEVDFSVEPKDKKVDYEKLFNDRVAAAREASNSVGKIVWDYTKETAIANFEYVQEECVVS